MMPNVLEPVVAAVTFEVDREGRRARIQIPGIAESEIEPIKNPVTGALPGRALRRGDASTKRVGDRYHHDPLMVCRALLRHGDRGTAYGQTPPPKRTR